MKDSLAAHLKNLKAALLKLKSSGTDGFEGLIAVTLQEITGVPFRIAGGGYQGGVDGAASFDSDAISFEGKLYKKSPPRTEVITKIADLTRNGVDSDLVWVLGATCRVSVQLANDVRADGKKAGISVLVMDWSDSGVPPLAAALAMGAARVHEFLKQRITEVGVLDAALNALSALSLHKDFLPQADRIRKELDAPAMGIALATEANAAWFKNVLSSKARARDVLEQPLAPADATAGTTLPRKTLVAGLSPIFTDAPDQKTAFVCGEEGCGKSWLVMQTWLEVEAKPLMLFVSPEEAISAGSVTDIIEILVNVALRQTGDIGSEERKRLWRRRFGLWARTTSPARPRIVVILDGINQRPSFEWGKIISKFASTVSELGGNVVCTVRTRYFDTVVKPGLSVGFKCHPVPVWEANERDEILRSKGINPARLTTSTANSLRNPRLLGIATELFGAKAIEDIAELSAERLLFEHLMAAGRDQYGEHPIRFVAKLKSHAAVLLQRVEQKQTSDLFIFEADTAAVADGRFFHAVEGEPYKFELRENGLRLALGYSVIETLRKAKRSGEDVYEALMKILEPVAALDNTANVILAALTVCSADDQEHIPDVTAALARGFASLQTPPEERFQSFVRLAKARPAAFAAAAASICLAGGHEPNFDWLQAALSEIGNGDSAWEELSQEIRRWLCVYTLAPEQGMFSHLGRESKEKVKQERAERVAKIEHRLKNLSDAERTIFQRMSETDGDIDALSGLAFSLLAGRMLAPFAEEIVAWAFGDALNGSIHAPVKKFTQLVSFNRSDWIYIRRALLEAVAQLRHGEASVTGKWVLLRVLYATGASEDAVEADRLYEELTKDREKFGPWRLLDDYCAADPCDPASSLPDNFSATSAKYITQDAQELFSHSSMRHEDHFFVDARPAIARFAVNVAVQKHREFAQDIVGRNDQALKFGLMELRKHNALITDDLAKQFVARWVLLNSAGVGDNRDAAFILQYMLMIAFPALSPGKQIGLLLDTNDGDPIFTELVEQMATPDAATFDVYWQKALRENDEYRQYVLLEIASAKGISVSSEVSHFIAANLSSISSRMRRAALALIARGSNLELLEALVNSGWGAIAREAGNNFEEWYGSLGLLHAAKYNLIDNDELLVRLSPRLYGSAATMLDSNVVREIVMRVDASLRTIVGLEGRMLAPEILMEIDGDEKYNPPRFRVDEVKVTPENAVQAFKQLSENDEQFQLRQKKNHDLFHDFVEELTAADARVIIDRISFEEFNSLVAAAPHIADHWYEMFLATSDEKLPAIHNFILLLAQIMSDAAPEKAAVLFRRVEDSNPLVRFTFGRNALTLDTVAAWKGGRSTPMDKLRGQRLDNATDDHALSQEVLAALDNKHTAFLQEYIAEKLGRPEPSEIARGVMVAGFSDKSPFNDEVLARHANQAGLIGEARKAAQKEYERNEWARHWFSMMCEASEAEQFWKHSILFMRIMDGRFRAWRDDHDRGGQLLHRFGLVLNSQLRNRFDKIKKKREKKLFGQDAPDICFLR